MPLCKALGVQMRAVLVLIFALSVTSCTVIYSGNIENNYNGEITVDSSRGVKGNPIVSSHESTEVPIFETPKGTCISILHGEQTKYYHVPAPPKWAKISGIWDVKFGLSVSPEGAYYIGTNGMSQKLSEVPACDT